MSAPQRVTNVVVNTYGLANLGFSLMVSMTSNYYAFFLTDVLLMPAAVMATLMMVLNLFDMLTVPTAGVIMQKSNLPWGKNRSWMLIGPPITLITFTLIFTNPPLEGVFRYLWIIIIYTIAHGSYNLSFGALSAILPILGKTPEDRAILSIRRLQFSSISRFIFGAISMPMLLFFTARGATVPAVRGYTFTSLVLSSVMLTMFWLVFKVTEPYETRNNSQSAAQQKKSNISGKEMLQQLFKSPPLLALIFGETARNVAAFALTYTIAYYFRYIIQNMSLMPVFMSSIAVIGVVASLLVQLVSKYMDKRHIYTAGLVLCLVGHTLAYLFARDLITFIIFMGINQVGVSFMMGISFAMFSDCCDYGELKTGKVATPFIMNLTNLSPKLGKIVSSGVIGFSLAAIGYVAEMEYTPQLAANIRAIIHLVPMLFIAVALVITTLFNKLTIETVLNMQNQLRANREADSASQAGV
ncbi:MAG TPA: glycoside-pentoside-hexuronide (GPH):cation symporter [Oscillospiraceae bacterium]|nr:glycoside-pentoside-hexuronide (GPH):cation symporter [Oscillospiraceae bacterium]